MWCWILICSAIGACQLSCACDAGRVAVMRGPLVYCAEQADNAGDLWTYRLADGVDAADATVTFESDLLGGVDAVTLPAVREAADAVDAPLYMSAQRDASDERTSLSWCPTTHGPTANSAK